MKGIILAGGTGSRLYPLTKVYCKQLLPVYDKPMIYYPFSVLMLAGIREVLIISTGRDLPLLRELLGDGSWLGMSIEYQVQEKPNGIAEAFIIGESFIGNGNVCLILGDNIFFGQHFNSFIQRAARKRSGATVFGYYVKNPEAYGVIEFDGAGNVLSIEEKPQEPKSNYVIPGLYFFDSRVGRIARSLRPSARGELEIVDVIRHYLLNKQLSVEQLGRGMAWLDTGNPSDLLKAASFVETIQNRTGLYVACIEEIAYKMGYITKAELVSLTCGLRNKDYREYLELLANEENTYAYQSIPQQETGAAGPRDYLVG